MARAVQGLPAHYWVATNKDQVVRFPSAPSQLVWCGCNLHVLAGLSLAHTPAPVATPLVLYTQSLFQGIVYALTRSLHLFPFYISRSRGLCVVIFTRIFACDMSFLHPKLPSGAYYFDKRFEGTCTVGFCLLYNSSQMRQVHTYK